MTHIAFNRYAYDPFIDFLKGVCILLVILGHGGSHSFQDYWIIDVICRPCVPMFLIIQVFHAYKKGYDDVKPDYKKIWRRVIKPFLYVELLIFLMYLCVNMREDGTFFDTLKYFLTSGSKRRGHYYVYIYVQFALLLPLLAPFFKKKQSDRAYLVILFIAASQLLEFLCNILNVPAVIYRLLFVRYLFLIYIGYVVVTEGIVINKKTLLAGLLSLIAMLLFYYMDPDLRPLFTHTRWKTEHWVCYYFLPYIYIPIIYLFYKAASRNEKICHYFKLMGKYSYEIFLVQMIFFTGSWSKNAVLSITGDTPLGRITYVTIALIVNILFVIWFSEWKASRRVRTCKEIKKE